MVWHCKTCGQTIIRSGTKERVMSAIRHHYQKHHPSRFRGFHKKAIKTKKEKGIISKSGSIPTAMLRGLVRKYRPEIQKILDGEM